MTAALSATEIAEFENLLKLVAANGRSEVGLEAGTDVGLPYTHHVLIPRSLKRECAFRVTAAEYADICQDAGIDVGQNPLYTNTDSETFLDFHANNWNGWYAAKGHRVRHAVGVTTIELDAGQGNPGDGSTRAVDRVVTTPHTVDQVKSFIYANIGHCNEGPVRDEDLNMVLAVRYWSVANGLVSESKSKEFREVADPDAADVKSFAGMDDRVRFVLSFAARAMLFAAARAYSWKKTNHCTGGTIAQGFARKALGDLWSNAGDSAARSKANTALTNAFYAATHPVSVHAALSMFAPQVEDHWAVIDSSYGIHLNYSIGMSVSMRMSGKDQVAGSAQVVDSVKVLGNLINESLSPFITNRSQMAALYAQYAAVKANSMRIHVGALWYFGGHPTLRATTGFNQKDEAFAALAQELGMISQKYYIGTTLASSPALKSLAAQCSDGNVETTWTRLYAERKAADISQLLAAVKIIHGSSATAAVADLISAEEVRVEAGVQSINQLLADDVTDFGAATGTTGLAAHALDLAQAIARAKAAHSSAWVAK